MKKIIGFFKNIMDNYRAVKYLINEEKSYKSKVNFLIKIKCLLKGFSTEKYELYNFRRNNMNNYLSDFHRRKTSIINRPYSIILDDKEIFSKITGISNKTSKLFGKIENGNIIMNHRKVTLSEFLKFIEQQNKIIIKKNHGGGGKGIFKIQYIDQKIYINNELQTEKELNKIIVNLNDYLIMEYLNQADYAHNIYPGTINTIRILTMKDPKTSEIIIPIAVHKFGSKNTEPADNVRNGGVTAQIDLETGLLNKGALHLENNKKIEWIDVHPDTKVKIEGTQIPDWQKMKEELIEVANEFMFLPYVGWDVLITNNGIQIIEGNNFSDVNILQIHQPLLVDKRVKDFYRYYKIIR